MKRGIREARGCVSVSREDTRSPSRVHPTELRVGERRVTESRALRCGVVRGGGSGRRRVVCCVRRNTNYEGKRNCMAVSGMADCMPG